MGFLRTGNDTGEALRIPPPSTMLALHCRPCLMRTID